MANYASMQAYYFTSKTHTGPYIIEKLKPRKNLRGQWT